MNTTEFYDRFATRLMSDFAFGNERAESAIKFALESLPASVRCVADIGCGIGWSTRQLGVCLPRAQIIGFDLSPALIGIAKRLTPNMSVEFRCEDVTKWTECRGDTFDAAIMLDVYEHISKSDRAAFHRALKDILQSEFTLVLTCPSHNHQEYLRTQNPQGLQPVDEDVFEDDAERLAHDLDANLDLFVSKSIWTENDYNHILISRHVRRPLRSSNLVPESLASRQRVIEDNLKLRPIRRDLFSRITERPPLVVATPNIDVYSETFIRAHVRTLPGPVHVLHGEQLQFTDDGEDFSSASRFRRLLSKINARLPGNPNPKGLLDRQVEWLHQLKPRAVLAEYAMAAGKVREACCRAHVPLITHFHGADAYARSIVQPSLEAYSLVFRDSAAIIAVSRHMEEQLLTLGAPEERVHYVPYFADPCMFREATPSAESRFLAVGRFVEKKSPHLTLLAFKKVLEEAPECRLRMVGDGPLLGACRSLATSLGIAGQVEFMGPLSHERIATELQGCRCFVQHSITASNGDSEGTPVAILEAQLSGLPVVATRHAGIPDVVVDGETGFLVDQCDVSAMANRMIRYAGSRDLALRHGRNARNRILADFGFDQTIGKLAAIIDAVAVG